MKKKSILLLLGVLLSLAQWGDTFAQCAMCRATVESNVSSGESTIGAGLNNGILYLMGLPYLLLAVVAFAWYRYSKKQSAQREKIASILRTRLSS